MTDNIGTFTMKTGLEQMYIIYPVSFDSTNAAITLPNHAIITQPTVSQPASHLPQSRSIKQDTMNPIFNVMESPWSDPGPGEWVPNYMRPEASGRQPVSPAVLQQQPKQQQQMPMPNLQGMFPMFPPMFPMFPPMFPIFPFPQQQRRRQQQPQWPGAPDSSSGSSSGASSGSSSSPSPVAARLAESAAASESAGPRSAAASSNARPAESPASWTSLPQGSRLGGDLSSSRRGGSVVGSAVGSVAPGESALTELAESLVEGGSRAGGSAVVGRSRASRNSRTVGSGATFGPGPLGFQLRIPSQTHPWAGGW